MRHTDNVRPKQQTQVMLALIKHKAKEKTYIVCWSNRGGKNNEREKKAYLSSR